ncbi:MAG TPA: PqqD family protein [Chthonomonadales bacterium]|nr:PqqD family protein [Chthonomonadales bacterium]
MRVPLSLRFRMVAGRFLPFLRVNPPDRQMVFTLRPMRHTAVEWDIDENGEARLRVPYRTDRVGRAVSFWFRLPEARDVQLDEVGSFVWGLCDGEHTVEGIVQKTAKHYKLNRREVEVSVTTYLQMLAQRRFIGFYQRGGRAQ